jgi:hypothetical protein
MVSLGLVSDTGSSATDGITRDGRVHVDGGDGQLVVFLDGVDVTPDADGTILVRGDGLHTVRVASTDAAGNTAEATLDFVLDTIAPAVVLGLVDDTGVSSTDGITRDGRASVSSSDGNLSVTLDGSVVTRDNSEHISATGDGSHRVEAVAIDLAGNSSTATVDFVLDTIVPEMAVELVSDTGVSATDRLTRDGRVSVSSSEGNVNATIDGIAVTRDSLGRVTATGIGSHRVAATATDAAGNSGSATLEFVLDSSPVAVENTRLVRTRRGVTEVVVTFTNSTV